MIAEAVVVTAAVVVVVSGVVSVLVVVFSSFFAVVVCFTVVISVCFKVVVGVVVILVLVSALALDTVVLGSVALAVGGLVSVNASVISGIVVSLRYCADTEIICAVVISLPLFPLCEQPPINKMPMRIHTVRFILPTSFPSLYSFEMLVGKCAILFFSRFSRYKGVRCGEGKTEILPLSKHPYYPLGGNIDDFGYRKSSKASCSML